MKNIGIIWNYLFEERVLVTFSVSRAMRLSFTLIFYGIIVLIILAGINRI